MMASTSVIFKRCLPGSGRAVLVAGAGLSTIDRLSTIAHLLLESPVHCSIDLDAPGKQLGQLELPRSSNTSGWAHLYVPIVSTKGGAGPVPLVVGGVHGDEPEGQVAALRLARETEPGDLP